MGKLNKVPYLPLTNQSLSFLEKIKAPANSPDLNPIEYILKMYMILD
jgi:hypothetical protein